MSGIKLVGVLPVSAFNIGLATGVSSMSVQIEKLSFDIGKLQSAIQTQVTFQAGQKPQGQADLAIMASSQFSAAGIASTVNPLNMAGSSADLQIDMATDIATIAGQAQALATALDSLELGLNVGGLAMWSYAGRAASFGTELTFATKAGYGSVKPDKQIGALVIACEDFKSWATFAASFNAGRSADREIEDSKTAILRFEGYFSGGELNTSTKAVFDSLTATKKDLDSRQSNMEFQLQVASGASLPSVDELFNAAASFDFAAAFSATEPGGSGQIDFSADINAINGEITDINTQIGDINAVLSAGGFAFWTYSGPVNGIGPALEGELEEGVPGGNGKDKPAYGLVIACEVPAVWGIFGSIFGAS